MLEGYYCIRERRAMILESSFVSLVEYINSVSAPNCKVKSGLDKISEKKNDANIDVYVMQILM